MADRLIMSKGPKWWIGLAAVIVVAIVVVVAFWPGEREPEYQGKTLSEWAAVWAKAGKAFSEGAFGYTSYEVRTNRELQALRAESDNARKVVVRLGTNSIPWLIRQIRYEIPAWRWKLLVGYVHIPGAGNCNSLVNAIRGEMPIERRNRARLAFAALGQDAQAAVPGLKGILSDPKMSAEAKLYASRCLGDVIGERPSGP
jgi:hypothetical protein